MKDKYVEKCPYCNGIEMSEAYQANYAQITPSDNKWGGMPLHHTICLECGSVVRSYVKEPKKLLKRKFFE